MAAVKRYRVYVTLKPQLLDSAGRTVRDALNSLGFDDVQNVRIGKLIEIEAQAADRSAVEEMCRKLLANPVTEEFEIEEVEG
ncbi:MAG: phosphoribosylformylglycinamidine synthase subunit PurS [Fimbriimonadales bacterium]|nr:MAG: phosphoribosylformylglycinamidine synthase subunit PurS [Fimbriimonadales bacterium]